MAFFLASYGCAMHCSSHSTSPSLPCLIGLAPTASTPNRTALPPPPRATLIVSGAQLPAPLQRFDRAPLRINAPVVAFPPDGAVLENAEILTLKIREGHAPFTVLLNGKPVQTGAHAPDIQLAGLSRGAATLSVIDARGQSARTQVWLD